jgi:hypothetical protein
VVTRRRAEEVVVPGDLASGRRGRKVIERQVEIKSI